MGRRPSRLAQWRRRGCGHGRGDRPRPPHGSARFRQHLAKRQLRALPERGRRAAAEEGARGVETMNLELTPADRAFRDEVRAFLDASLPEHLREAGRNPTSVFTDKKYSLAWQKILHAKGWAAPAWPKE